MLISFPTADSYSASYTIAIIIQSLPLSPTQYYNPIPLMLHIHKWSQTYPNMPKTSIDSIEPWFHI
jgi:hypothetical protein